MSSPFSARRPVDPAALARALRRQAATGAAPWLHGEIARRMAERLALIRLQPAVVVDWWAAAGGSAAALAQAYPKAARLRVEPATLSGPAAGPAPKPRWWSPQRWRAEAAAIDEDAVPEAAGQLLWANMVLHAVADPPALLQRWQRAIAVEGFLMFSSLGPDTLAGLRELYRDAGWGPPHAPFTDMHDLGDMLIEAGFADPVMDQEKLRLTWATPEALLAELRTLGGNADPARHAGLRTPRWRDRLLAALRDRAGADGRVGLDFEIVYGHAFKALPRAAVAAETRVALEDLRRMARSPRRGAAPR